SARRVYPTSATKPPPRRTPINPIPPATWTPLPPCSTRTTNLGNAKVQRPVCDWPQKTVRPRPHLPHPLRPPATLRPVGQSQTGPTCQAAWAPGAVFAEYAEQNLAPHVDESAGAHGRHDGVRRNAGIHRLPVVAHHRLGITAAGERAR